MEERMNRTIAAFALMLATVSTSSANVIHVPDYVKHYFTIQSGINAAQRGDTVAVWGPAPGQTDTPYVYQENVVCCSSVTVVNWSYDTTLAGYYPPANRWVVIKGVPDANLPVIDITTPPQTMTTIKGFTITGGNCPAGGGIKCVNSCAMIEDDSIFGNTAILNGGGVYWAEEAGADTTDSVIVDSCVVDSNVASDSGGGVFIRKIGQPGQPNHFHICESQIVANTATYVGGGLCLIGVPAWSPAVFDTIICGNLISCNHLKQGWMGGDIRLGY
jgi:hypothetical protein